jgi:hypothetical protein
MAESHDSAILGFLLSSDSSRHGKSYCAGSYVKLAGYRVLNNACRRHRDRTGSGGEDAGRGIVAVFRALG